ncbi:MAG: hypothetical protein GZ091_02400 [Paludibacter sp.]|nr:hypothetical protein [Paludibacter sp.]
MHTIIAFDNKGNDLSSFFQMCGDETRSMSIKAKIDYSNIETEELTSSFINTEVSKFNGDLIFIAYSHGDETCLYNSSTKEDYVSEIINHDIFENAFIYTFSCKTSVSLGLELYKNGVRSYWGYKDSAWVVMEYLDEFCKCATKGLMSLYEGNTVGDSIDQMIQLHSDYIDKLYQTDPQAAGILVQNRESLDVHGDKDIRLF